MDVCDDIFIAGPLSKVHFNSRDLALSAQVEELAGVCSISACKNDVSSGRLTMVVAQRASMYDRKVLW